MAYEDIFNNDITTPIRGGGVALPGEPLPPHTRALWIGVGGTLVVTTDVGDEIEFENVSDGVLIPIHAAQIEVATTCDSIRYLY